MNLELLEKSGLLDILLPELARLKNMEQCPEYHHKDVYEHSLMVYANIKSDNKLLRFAALLHDIGKFETRTLTDGIYHFLQHEVVGADLAREICKRFHMSNDDTEYVTSLIFNHMRLSLLSDAHISKKGIRRLLNSLADKIEKYPNYLSDLIELNRADITSHNPVKVADRLAKYSALIDKVYEVLDELKNAPVRVESPLDGTELICLFNLKAGKIIGDIKDMLIEKVIEGEIETKEQAIEVVKEYLNEKH